ncbi:MAG: DUF2786 domain-containing protein [Myxococcales bacterium]|nr:DUF2786 domain-containing protein [Myxococcales bacterium]
MTTTATNLDAVIRKIADLRRLATSSNLHEAEVAAAAAARLAEKHRISEAEIEDAGTEPGEQAVQDREVLDDDRGRTVVWKRTLAVILSAHYGCALIRVPEKVNESFVYHLLIVGRPSDTAIVRYLYAWLSLDLARIATREARGRASWERSWLVGAVTGIREQLTKAAAARDRGNRGPRASRPAWSGGDGGPPVALPGQAVPEGPPNVRAARGVRERARAWEERPPRWADRGPRRASPGDVGGYYSSRARFAAAAAVRLLPGALVEGAGTPRNQ